MHEIFQFLPKFHIFHISFYPIFLPFFFTNSGGGGELPKKIMFIITPCKYTFEKKCMRFSNFYANSSSFPPKMHGIFKFLPKFLLFPTFNNPIFFLFVEFGGGGRISQKKILFIITVTLCKYTFEENMNEIF